MTNSQHENVRTASSVLALIGVLAAVFISWGTIKTRLELSLEVMKEIRASQAISTEAVRQIDSRVSFLEGYIRSEQKKAESRTDK